MPDRMQDLYDRARLSKAPQDVRARVERLEHLLERLFTVPGIDKPIGLDALLSLVPGVGTISGAALGTYLVWEARNLGLSRWQLARMNLNTLVDMALGAIPVIGVIPDFFFRSNSRNLRIIRRHLDKHHPARPDFG
ncbi:DUF4112 domain-containing protein [Sphingomicrobium astaxanthinifaciens]|uniref:DUF4112 domain-containing protein n=1 Tax=Sphingomicrobium astaxanthinifaciens TaxID=1227949 RepID=UPI001FCCAC2C|nr:DUF4112 domain-containing protein [Sphingomicrobium astaxanthinifaciens]MCJ7421832.1 DUF4112 domain-containing protein [Sphingomicrobium astaxanthinifaciens]